MLQESTAHELVGEVIGREATACFKVTGDSMYPFLVSGQKIQVETIPQEELIPGDIIAFRHNSGICSHRIIKREKRGYRDYLLTKGDANLFWDALLTETPDNPILGRVIAIYHKGKPMLISHKKQRTTKNIIILLSLVTGSVFAQATEKEYRFTLGRRLLIAIAKILRRLTISVSWLNVYIQTNRRPH